jgi:hypothetical protein
MSRYSRIFSEDPATGITTIYHTEDEGQSHWFEKVQDVTPILEHNKGRMNGVDERANWRGDMHHVAEIPLTVMLEHPEFYTDEAALRKFLNDKDNAVFRTRPGRL